MMSFMWLVLRWELPVCFYWLNLGISIGLNLGVDLGINLLY